MLPTVTLNENLKAPIKKGDVVGHVKYEVEGITYEADLLANSDVKPSRVFIKILIFVIIIKIYKSICNNQMFVLRFFTKQNFKIFNL